MARITDPTDHTLTRTIPAEPVSTAADIRPGDVWMSSHGVPHVVLTVLDYIEWRTVTFRSWSTSVHLTESTPGHWFRPTDEETR